MDVMDAPTCKECGSIACYVYSCAMDPKHEGVHIPHFARHPWPQKNLRDEFAMAALAALIPLEYEDRDQIASDAYHYADAMLTARTKEPDHAIVTQNAADTLELQRRDAHARP